MLIYCIVSFECCANVCIFKEIGYLSYQWVMVYENCPFFVLCVFFLFSLCCEMFVLLLGFFFLFYVMDYVFGETIFLGYGEYVFPLMLFCLFCDG